MRRVNPPWGLRIRVLASAVLIGAVSLVVFAVLLIGLLDQRNTATHGRDVTTALNTARELQTEVLTMESAARGVRAHALGELRGSVPHGAPQRRGDRPPGSRSSSATTTRRSRPSTSRRR